MLNKQRRRNKKSASSSNNSPLRVLGIALVVDEKGVGARLVARYPVVNEGSSFGDDGEEYEVDDDDDDDDDDNSSVGSGGNAAVNPKENAENTTTPEESNDDDDNNLFFSLTSRQMAKLFRTKKALCNQPMTLRVNRTIFCCHAVLMEKDVGLESSSDVESGGDAGDTSSVLQLFSVVVALSAPAREAVVLPFGNFWEGGSSNTLNDGGGGGGNLNNNVDMRTASVLATAQNDDHMDLERYLRHVTNSTEKTEKNDVVKKKKTAARVSSAFLAIRRVHISLARLCRALEREERRCKYVSLQAQDFFAIRNERQKQWENCVGSGGGASATASTASGGATSANNSTSEPIRKPHHVRHSSFSNAAAAGSATSGGGGGGVLEQTLQNLSISQIIPQEQEQEQEILELILSAPPRQHPRHYGNLIGELVQVFHSLSRRDHTAGKELLGSSNHGHPPTPINLLCEQGSVVYINQHLAIPMEAVGMDSAGGMGGGGASSTSTVQPYHTLLFPHASPSELLQTFLASGSAAPQHLSDLLLTVNPQKSLQEISVDANLPLHTTLQIASFLVSHNAAVVCDVVSSKSRLTCLNMELLPQLSLDFCQAFPGVHLFGVVSFLTTSKTLGETMSNLTRLNGGDVDTMEDGGGGGGGVGGSFDMGGDDNDDMASWIRESLLNSQVYQSRLRMKMESAAAGARMGGSGGRATTTGGINDSLSSEEALFRQPFQPYASAGSSSRLQPPPPVPLGNTAPEDMILHQYPYQQQQPHQQQHTQQQQRIKELEELLYSIAIWLLSHGVITHLQEYIVVLAAVDDTTEPVSMRLTPNADDVLFQELFDNNNLNGDISLQNLAWRLGMDPQTLRAWAHRHKRTRILWRVPLSVNAMTNSSMVSSSSSTRNDENNNVEASAARTTASA